MGQIFVAFSEYLNFKNMLKKSSIYLAGDLFAGTHLQLDGVDVGVFEPDPLHGVDVLAPVPFEFGQSGVHVLFIFKVLESNW